MTTHTAPNIVMAKKTTGLLCKMSANGSFGIFRHYKLRWTRTIPPMSTAKTIDLLVPTNLARKSALAPNPYWTH